MPQETHEIFAARRANEAAIVPLAAANATRAQITRLRGTVREEHAPTSLLWRGPHLEFTNK